jgi:hypothetical protein
MAHVNKRYASRTLEYFVTGTAHEIARKYHGLSIGLEQEDDWCSEYLRQAREHWLRVENAEKSGRSIF